MRVGRGGSWRILSGGRVREEDGGKGGGRGGRKI
jgi:hypothetical protein